MYKFVVLDKHIHPNADFTVEQKILEAQGIQCILAECKNAEEVLEVAKDADGIGLIYFDMNKEVIDQLEKCQVIVRYGIGYDSIDVKAATEKGIIVCNLPDYCQIDVATHAMGFILDMCRKITLFDRHCRAGNWDCTFGYPIHRLPLQTLGLVGFGSIARTLVQVLKGFNMENIIAYDPYAPAEAYEALGVRSVSLDELYAQSDIISLHVPLIESTHHMINEESIAKMKDGVMLVNTARGPVIKLDALLAGLESGKIRAAAMDVVETEPINDANHPLYKHPGVIVTPHSAYTSVEAELEQHQKVAYSGVDVLVKKIMPYNAVNKKDLEAKGFGRP